MAPWRNGVDARFHGSRLKRFFGGGLVADFPMKNMIGLLVAIFAKDRRIGSRGLMRVYEHGKLFVLNFDKLGSIGGRVLIFRNDEGDFLRLEEHLAGGGHHLLIEEKSRHPGKAGPREVLAG